VPASRTSRLACALTLYYDAAAGRPPSWLHFRFVSRLWGFVDDLVVSLESCGADATRVQAQSQLRLGYGDLGVNAARIAALWRHLDSAFDRAESDACV